VGHIEDVVVHPDYRKRGISGKILDYLKRLSVTWNCYKIILDCAPSLKAVYEKSGFRQKSISMAYYVENEIDMALHTLKSAVALIPSCPYVGDIIKRNGFVNSGDKAMFIYFESVQGDIPFTDEVEQKKIGEIQGLLEKSGYSKMARVLYIVNVFDVVQKYKIISNQNVVFLYITTISQIKGSSFEWEKDNSFLDKIIQIV
jgi:nucleoside diphosphate kinase